MSVATLRAFPCRRDILQQDLQALFARDKAAFDKLTWKQLDRATVSDANHKRCPTPDCQGRVLWSNAENEVTSQGKGRRWLCECCNNTSCLLCQAQPYHEGLTCEAHRVANKGQRDLEEQLSLDLMAKNKYKPCPSCGCMVEKTKGCDNMMCSYCKYKWCWRCGAENAACRCTALSHGFLDNTTGKILRRPPAIKRKRDD